LSKRVKKGQQIDTINREGDLFQPSFDLHKQDELATGLGIDFLHLKAMPSPIGMKDKGDYRKPDKLDTLSSNGMLYTKAGCFTATMVGNSKSQSRAKGGFIDQSTSRLIMPRFYNKQDGQANGDRIYVAPGDRIYVSDPNADVLVPNYQRMDFEATQDNTPMFPICKVEFITDSLGNSFTEGIDFVITPRGDISWVAGAQNPGTDPDTGKGRVYSVRYLYKSYWYVIQIPNEVRITNVTDGEIRSPQRMASHIVIQREYVYHSSINGKKTNESEKSPRAVSEPIQSTTQPDAIKVNMSMFNGDDEQS
jgi:hypothetical protein